MWLFTRPPYLTIWSETLDQLVNRSGGFRMRYRTAVMIEAARRAGVEVLSDVRRVARLDTHRQ